MIVQKHPKAAGPEPMVSRGQEIYAPRRPRTVRVIAMVLVVAALGWAIADLSSASRMTLTVIAVTGLVTAGAAGVVAHRSWKAHHAIPAQLRAQLATVLRVELREGSVRTRRYRFGTLLTPMAPRRIVVKTVAKQMPLPDIHGDPKMIPSLVAAAENLTGGTYKLHQKKSKPGQRIVLVSYTPTPEAPLGEKAAAVERIRTAAVALLGEGTKVRVTWDAHPDQLNEEEGPETVDPGDKSNTQSRGPVGRFWTLARGRRAGQDAEVRTESEEDGKTYMTAVDITAADGKVLALANKAKTTVAQLRTRLPGHDFKVMLNAQEDKIRFERRQPLPAMVMPPKQQAGLVVDHATYRQFEIPIGLAEGGVQATWKPRTDPHLLIIGSTGGGKTIAEHGIIQPLTQAGWRTWMIDGKRIEFLGYDQWPNVEFLAQRIEEQVKLVEQTHAIMEERYDMIMERKITAADMDPLVLVIDEVTSFLTAASTLHENTRTKDMPKKSPVLERLGNIARLGRTSKVHMVFGLQRPDARIVDGEIRDNFSARLSLGALESPQGSMMMWNNPAIGVQVPDIGGRGIGRINGEPTQVQVVYTANPEPGADDYHPGMIEAARPRIHVHSRKTFGPPVATDEEAGITWKDIVNSPVLDGDGNEIVLDPVTSEESRRMRKRYAGTSHAASAELTLRAARSAAAGLALFESEEPSSSGEAQSDAKRLPRSIRNIKWGQETASRLWELTPANRQEQVWCREEKTSIQDKEQHPREPTEEGWQSLESLEQEDEGRSVSASEVRPGQHLSCDELDEKILVSDTEVEDDGETVLVTGYDKDGVEHTAALEAEETVEVSGEAVRA